MKAELNILAVEIKAALEASKASIKEGLVRAKEAGEKLLKARELTDHGDWGPWLDANFAMSQRSASDLMKLARNWKALSAVQVQGVTVQTVASALKFLRKEKPTKRRKKAKAGQEAVTVPQQEAVSVLDGWHTLQVKPLAGFTLEQVCQVLQGLAEVKADQALAA